MDFDLLIESLPHLLNLKTLHFQGTYGGADRSSTEAELFRDFVDSLQQRVISKLQSTPVARQIEGLEIHNLENRDRPSELLANLIPSLPHLREIIINQEYRLDLKAWLAITTCDHLIHLVLHFETMYVTMLNRQLGNCYFLPEPNLWITRVACPLQRLRITMRAMDPRVWDLIEKVSITLEYLSITAAEFPYLLWNAKFPLLTSLNLEFMLENLVATDICTVLRLFNSAPLEILRICPLGRRLGDENNCGALEATLSHSDYFRGTLKVLKWESRLRTVQETLIREHCAERGWAYSYAGERSFPSGYEKPDPLVEVHFESMHNCWYYRIRPAT